ncbi:hypothetical protein B0T17DRAFT_620158 [Bombardia bombarda]|uniref:Uncharacterized protein n=1 Tax=Bombardia bombarda TaxID=252184 RepID=A0AA39WH89_9PEZI|nr:hypothetical protein B0T17DRAFT_620158 [Bombardia bombarda]
MEADCKSLAWDQLVKQADISFAKICDGTTELSCHTILLDKARLMAETIHTVVIFESFLNGGGDAGNATSPTDSWTTHLSSAMDVFQQMYTQHEHSPAGPPDKPVLLRILDDLVSPSDQDSLDYGLDYMRNQDQAAFRFFTASLTLVENIAATALALYAVGLIAALDATKKSIDVPTSITASPHLLEFAREVEQVLHNGLRRLLDEESVDATHASQSANSISSSGSIPNPPLQPCYNHHLPQLQRESGHQVRAMALPICVAGCAAEAGTGLRERFRATMARATHSQPHHCVGDTSNPSSIVKAWKIMEAVWARSETGRSMAGWDVAACLNILGRLALLV